MPQKAKLQVRDYHRTAEEEEKILEEHNKKFDPAQNGAINTVEEYIEEVTETHSLGLDYVWTFYDHKLYERVQDRN